MDRCEFVLTVPFFLSVAVPPTTKPTASLSSNVSAVSVNYTTQPSVDVKQQAPQDGGKSNSGLIYGLVFGFLVLLLLVGGIVLFIVARRKRSPKLQ